LAAVDWTTAFGVAALTFMMAMYALEHRHPGFILAFALGCALASTYGFLSGAWPFGVVEAIWCLIAVRKFMAVRSRSSPS
jgi:hypothetical protein